MKKIVFLVYLFPVIVFSQETDYMNGECVSGNCQNGKGVFNFISGKYAGDKYAGFFKDGDFHGKGRYDYSKTHAYYDGMWVNGSREDENALYIGKTYRYRGGYENNKQNGFATIAFLSGKRAGDSLVCTFKNGIATGEGKYFYSSQNKERLKYIGHFENNKFNGQGTLYYKDKIIQQGEWKDDKFLGKRIGTLYHQPVYWDMLDTVTTSQTTYRIDQQKLYLLKATKSQASKGEIHYFYIKDGDFIQAVVEIHKNTVNAISSNTSSSYPAAKVDDNKSINTIDVRLNNSEELLKHLNRNQYNKPAKGALTHIKKDLYHDENFCVWVLFPEKFSIYHNPKGQWKNLKFVRPDPNNSMSHETILKVDESVISSLKKGVYPDKISGQMVVAGEYQQTYNFEHSGISNFWNYFNHWEEDIYLHNQGWIEYAQFNQPRNGYAEPTAEEYNFARGIIGSYENQVVTIDASGRIVHIDAINKDFDLSRQIQVTKNSNYSEGSIQDKMDFTRYYLIHSGSCIGWVDNLNQTISYSEKKAIEFEEQKGVIKGLNLFGSIYIGPNNPTKDGKPNYELPPQDPIDAAALRHDTCYDNRGAKGPRSALFNIGVYDCDAALVTDCSFYIPESSSLHKGVENLTNSLMKWSYDPDIKTRATLVGAAFSSLAAGKAVANNVPAVIDFAAGATKTGLGFATTATAGFFATTGAMSIAVPVLSVAAVNLLQTEAKCLYSFFKDNAPDYCYSTMGIITHAWDVKAAKEMATGVLSGGIGKGITKGAKMLDVNTMIKAGKTTYDGGQVATQTVTTLGSLFSTQEKDNK